MADGIDDPDALDESEKPGWFGRLFGRKGAIELEPTSTPTPTPQAAETVTTDTPSPEQAAPVQDPTAPEEQGPRPVPPVIVTGEQWRIPILTSDMKIMIAALMELLDAVVVQVKTSNSIGDGQVLTLLERNSLIAMLETVLVLLRNEVMVEKGLMTSLTTDLKKFAAKTAEKELERGAGLICPSSIMLVVVRVGGPTHVCLGK